MRRPRQFRVGADCVARPVNWKCGDKVIVPPPRTVNDVEARRVNSAKRFLVGGQVECASLRKGARTFNVMLVLNNNLYYCLIQ
ncbi:MAG: hypothetical protein FD180_2527 [Planctomycetota bacterium]|nr:MAG: hypothetical protein FD180_2527 [Planctomycetota bacterium]